MSRDRKALTLLRNKAVDLKKEFEDEIDRIIHDIEEDRAAADETMPRNGDFNEDTQEYDARLESLKEELKRLKKIKKQQKKINKLEDEKEDVIKKIERKKAQHRKHKTHIKH